MLALANPVGDAGTGIEAAEELHYIELHVA
jgi:hypothetical protein